MINSIQYLRIIAAMGVTFYHAGAYFYPHFSLDNEAYYWFFSGRIGVDLFFMISGFVMYLTEHHAHERGLERASSFFKKRLIRVAPMYWVMTMVFYWNGEYDENTCGLAYSLFFIPETPAINPADPPFFCYPKLFTGWTLNYEMWFYVAFSLSLLFGRMHTAAIFLLLTTPMVFSWVYAGNISLHSRHNTTYETAWLSLIANPLLLEFLAGILLGMVYQSQTFRVGKGMANAALALAIVLFVGVYVFGYFAVQAGGLGVSEYIMRIINYRTSHGILNAGLCCFVLFFLILIYEKCHPVPIGRFFETLANASYLIYLLHVPILQILMRKLTFLNGNVWASFLVFTVLLLVLSLLLHITVEVPLTRWLRSVFLPRKLNAA